MQYDVNQLFKVITNFLSGYAPENYCSLQWTSNTGYPQESTDYSFCKQHSSVGDFGGDYCPGNVIDILLNKSGNSYFVSLFFNTARKVVQYRLIRLVELVEAPLEQPFYRMKEIANERDASLDEGAIDFGEDYVETGKKVTGWMRYQIDNDGRSHLDSGSEDGRRIPIRGSF